MKDLVEEVSPGVPSILMETARYTTSAILSHADPVDPIPYAIVTLNNTRANLENAATELRNYKSNSNVQHLHNMNSHLDQVLNLYGSWPIITAKGGAAAQANRTFKEYRRLAEKAIDDLRSQLKDMGHELSNQANLDQARQHQAQTRLSELEDEVGKLTNKISADESRLDSALTTSNEAFSESQRRRQEEFEQWIKEQGDNMTELAKPSLDATSAAKNEAEATLQDILKLHKDVEKVSGKATAAILAKDYGSYSTREWVSGILFYFLGFGILGFVAWHLIQTLGQISIISTPSWQYVSLKLGVTVTAAVAAGVSFRVASAAISRAGTNKRVQLELGTIGTFLADVNDEERVKQAKMEFVDRMFGRAWETRVENASAKESSELTIIEKFIELTGKFTGK
ncbi:hypothetical protein FHX82_002721 [Amycolatopsis bartoniae]|uniref:Uncharacterized protein n=1 Tax=Amycolatopsis bartoniae TaxID=941986 RepID=A0A8H9IZA7_9PSEU|nr:hypothetical protein [Amycolatopsis bartoniae]MBB2935667.1 hypothetical protein [Amycolatopsis bartoniae]TVT02321.1 hypothetical protein FNH07_27600 [Amycolatopsis bartoniae]GHF60972.1 hypothetical protein GCM10017566_37950 [Amycolatopsis bartoniae]